jgi:acetyl-CoA synthetase
VFVKDLPRNRAGKIMRRMIRAVVLNRPTGDLSVVENPDALEEIKKAFKT